MVQKIGFIGLGHMGGRMARNAQKAGFPLTDFDEQLRFAARGYSGTRFRLRMTRQEIGSYLGMKLETISRTFSRLQSEKCIAVQNKDIEIKDLACLRKLVQQGVGGGIAA